MISTLPNLRCMSRRTVAFVALALLAGSVLSIGCGTQRSQAPAVASEYFCPMHPHIVSEKPGECPICGMDLVAREKHAEGGEVSRAASTERQILYWYDPMKPEVHFDRPGKSPFMDMDLVPKYTDEVAGATIELTPEAIQAAGVVTVRAEQKMLRQTTRAAGTIEVAETGLSRIAARVPGRLDRLYLNFTGETVRKGDPIYAIYSPELVSAQREFLLALDNLGRARAGGDASYLTSAESLLKAARDRLRLWGISQSQLSRLERTQQPELTVVVHSPVSGTVLERHSVLGQYVTEGQDLYLLADLGQVWLQARVYEHELAALRVGQEAVVTLTSAPGREFRGRVRFIEPVLDPATRTARVRIELPNPDGALRPGMFANAELQVDLGPRLVVPRSALLDTGTRQVVYVREGGGSFVGREVRVGARAGESVEILEGIGPGEEVVARASFLIDSQSQLQTGASVQWGGASEVPQR